MFLYGCFIRYRVSLSVEYVYSESFVIFILMYRFIYKGPFNAVQMSRLNGRNGFAKSLRFMEERLCDGNYPSSDILRCKATR